MAGILGYGAYVPRYRITTAEIAKHHGKDAAAISVGLLVNEKSVPGLDEDSITMGVEAGLAALQMANVDAKQLGALYSGSESKVYAVKPNSTMIGTALGLGELYHAADLEFACKAGTAAMQIVWAMVKANLIKTGLAIGSDTAQGRPGDVLEYSAAAGASALVIGEGVGVLAEIEATCSSASDTPDFWRRTKDDFPTHLGKFTAAPAYEKQIVTCAKALLTKIDAKPEDFDHVVFHTPNGKFPQRVAKLLGFTAQQLAAGYVVPELGNTYSAAALLALCAALDQAKAGERILLVSFGSGAGSDAFSLRTTKAIERARQRRLGPTLRQQLAHKIYLDYGTYLQQISKGQIGITHG